MALSFLQVWYFFSYEAEISSCFVQLLHVHQGKVSYLGPNYFFNRIGACKGRFQSQQLRMFCPLELCLALASTETSNFHAKFNQDIKSFFKLDKKLASAICPRTWLQTCSARVMHDDRFEVPVCTNGWITCLNQPFSIVLDCHTFFPQGIHDLNESFNKVLLSGTVLLRVRRPREARISKRLIWHASCILLGSAMSMTSCF